MANLDGFSQFSFDEGDSRVGVKSERYKGSKGKTDRVSFGWFPEKEDGSPDFSKTPRYIGCKRGYREGVGYFVVNSPDLEKLSSNPPKDTVGTILIVWPTDKNGNVDKNRIASGEFSVQPWVFSGDKYQKLKTKNSDFPFGKHDLKISCEDEQYQKLDFTPCGDSMLALFREKKPDVYRDIMARVKDAVEALPAEMAQNLTVAQIRERAAKKGNAAPSGGSKTTSRTEGVSTDVDALLGDVLAD